MSEQKLIEEMSEYEIQEILESDELGTLYEEVWVSVLGDALLTRVF